MASLPNLLRYALGVMGISSTGESSDIFAATRWSLVVHASTPNDPAAHAALSELCAIYWQPVYVFIRSRGHSPHDAEDLTQDYFAHLIDRDLFSQADPDRGKLRAFLLTDLKFFLSNQWQKAQAQKRGGGRKPVSIDFATIEMGYQFESAALSPDQCFEKRWAMTTLENALSKLKAEYAEAGKLDLFDAIKPAIQAGGAMKPLGEIAQSLGISLSNVKVSIHRLKQKYRSALEAEIAQTLEDPSQTREELSYLRRVLTAA